MKTTSEDLKKFVLQSLDTNGTFGKVKAQIRTSIYKLIESQDRKTQMDNGFMMENPLASKAMQTGVGRLCAEIICEFMSFYHMDYSLSVFTPECNLQNFPKKEEIQTKLGITNSDSSSPILLQLINLLEKTGMLNLKSLKQNNIGSSSINAAKPPIPLDNWNLHTSNAESNKKADNTVSTDSKTINQSDEIRQPSISEIRKEISKNNKLAPLDRKKQDNKNSTNQNNIADETKKIEKNIAREDKPLNAVSKSDDSQKEIEKLSQKKGMFDFPPLGKPNKQQLVVNDFNNEEKILGSSIKEDKNKNRDQNQNAGEDRKSSKDTKKEINENINEKKFSRESYSNNPKTNNFVKEEKTNSFDDKKQMKEIKKSEKDSKGTKNNSYMGFNSKPQEEEAEEILEEIEPDKEPDASNDVLSASKINRVFTDSAGMTVSQSLGMDPSVDSLALEQYDHVEKIIVIRDK